MKRKTEVYDYKLIPDENMLSTDGHEEIDRAFLDRVFSLSPFQKTTKTVKFKPCKEMKISHAERSITAHPETLKKIEKTLKHKKQLAEKNA